MSAGLCAAFLCSGAARAAVRDALVPPHRARARQQRLGLERRARRVHGRPRARQRARGALRRPRASGRCALFAGLEARGGRAGAAAGAGAARARRLARAGARRACRTGRCCWTRARRPWRFALMLLPATAMGATLPLLTRALAPHSPRFGVALGRLYGWNTLGGVAGAIASETLLVPRLGLTRTAFVAAALNLAAVAVALGARPAPSARRPSSRWRPARPRRRRRRGALAARAPARRPRSWRAACCSRSRSCGSASCSSSCSARSSPSR